MLRDKILCQYFVKYVCVTVEIEGQGIESRLSNLIAEHSIR